MNELVILDLDGVIINGQSQQIFLDYIFRKKIVGLFFYLKIYFWFILYKLGLIKNPKKIMLFAFSFLRDRKEKEIKEIVDVFFEEVLRKFIFFEIIDIIKWDASLLKLKLVILGKQEQPPFFEVFLMFLKNFSFVDTIVVTKEKFKFKN